MPHTTYSSVWVCPVTGCGRRGSRSTIELQDAYQQVQAIRKTVYAAAEESFLLVSYRLQLGLFMVFRFFAA